MDDGAIKLDGSVDYTPINPNVGPAKKGYTTSGAEQKIKMTTTHTIYTERILTMQCIMHLPNIP
eukprot:15194519-Ditylum_brightwellii.AAC.1